MDWCEVNWGVFVPATAAVVQALGSIAAIGVAIWVAHRQDKKSAAMVSRQHWQNVKLINDERARVSGEKADERKALRSLVSSELKGLIDAVDVLHTSFERYPPGPGPISPPVGVIDPTTAKTRCAQAAGSAKPVLNDLKNAFAGDIAGSLAIIKLEQVATRLKDVDQNTSKLKGVQQGKYTSDRKAEIDAALNLLSPSV